MADDKTKAGGQDRTRINVSEDYELRLEQEVRRDARPTQGSGQEGRRDGRRRRERAEEEVTAPRHTGILSSMRASVVLGRERGVYKPMLGPKDKGEGDLHLTYRSVKNRRVAVLQLIGCDRQWPNLYDPKLVELSADRMRFVGSEQVEEAWVVQEWICVLV